MINPYVDLFFFVALPFLVVTYRYLKSRSSLSIALGFLLLTSLLVIRCIASTESFWLIIICDSLVLVSAAQLILYFIKRPLLANSIFCISLTLLFGNLIFVKSGLPWIPHTYRPIEWIGLSYFTLRGVDLLNAARAGRVKEIHALPKLLYLTYFAPLVSGPIERYLKFTEQISQPLDALTFEQVRKNLIRICIGIVKILVLGPWAMHNSVLRSSWPQTGVSAIELGSGLFAYLLYIYFDFSGYCDCAIAVSDFFGIHLPENFRYPFLAGNIQDFWNRWHISMSHWFRDNVFFSLFRWLTVRFPNISEQLWLGPAIIFTFGLIGAWHGLAWNWILYGIYHGIGVAVLITYQNFMTNHFGDDFLEIQALPVYRLLATVATIVFVALGLLLTLDPARLSEVIASVK